MKHILSLLFIAAFLAGCSFIKSLTETTPGGATSTPAAETDLIIAPAQTEITLEWGKAAEIPVEISWGGAQKYPVQLTPAADTPKWLTVETKPAILQPPGRATLNITAALGEAELGSCRLILEASAYGMNEPKRVEVQIEVQRQAGKFVPVLAAPVTVECRGICGKVKNGKVTFYDVLREKNQACNETSDLPESQRIGAFSYSISTDGFGFGRTCDVAGVFGTDGSLSMINLGLAGTTKKRGEALFKVSAAQSCWLSADNTVALITVSGALSPYDVRTGQALGLGCSVSGSDISDATLTGNHLTVQSSRLCEWDIK
jgi:hypothetical protein